MLQSLITPVRLLGHVCCTHGYDGCCLISNGYNVSQFWDNFSSQSLSHSELKQTTADKICSSSCCFQYCSYPLHCDVLITLFDHLTLKIYHFVVNEVNIFAKSQFRVAAFCS